MSPSVQHFAEDQGLSLLQVTALKHNHQKSIADKSSNPGLCRTGIRHRNVCYDESCGRNGGTPGGRGCGNLPGGNSACCATQITRSNRVCTGPMMQRCIIPHSRPRGMGNGMGMGMGMGLGQVVGEGGGEEIVVTTAAPQEGQPGLPHPVEIVDPVEVEELALCEDTLTFTSVLQSNLGGHGPDDGEEALIFGNVAPNTNLKIVATTPYTPNSLNPAGGVMHNGVHNGFGVINMGSSSSVDLSFKLVDSRTGAPKTSSDFAITFFDGDHGMSHESREAIKVSGFTSYIIAAESTLDVDPIQVDAESRAAGNGIAKFTSKMRGSKVDNPLEPMNMNTLQRRRTVALLFENKSEFQVTASETGYTNPQGRNILFAGASSLICNADAKCTGFQCPNGMRMRQNAEFIICATKPCSVDDSERCCFDVED